MTIDQILRAVEQLSLDEQKALIERLNAQVGTAPVEGQSLDLLVFDVGPWPAQLTLRREDEYSDDQR